MGIFNWLSGFFSDNTVGITNDDSMVDMTTDLPEVDSICNESSVCDDNVVNPVNGLPMIGGIGGVDVEGNPFGTDFSHDDSFSSGIDDSFSSGGDFDDW